jgi:hypothetical protein
LLLSPWLRPRKTKPSTKIAALPQGKLTGQGYVNDALGLTYEYPNDWDASTDPKETLNLDPNHPEKPVVQCSRVLLSIREPSKGEGKFSSVADLIAIDPRCLTVVPFPQSWMDQQDKSDVIDVIIKNFKHSAFLPPDRVKTLISDDHGHIEFLLTGGMIINANEMINGRPNPEKQPLEVHTSFFVVESQGFWIVLAYLADDPSEKKLSQSKFSLPDFPPPQLLRLTPAGNLPATQ